MSKRKGFDGNDFDQVIELSDLIGCPWRAVTACFLCQEKST